MISGALKRGKNITPKTIQQFFDCRIDRIGQLNLDNLSSANGAVASKNSGIRKLKVFFADGSTRELALKTKSQQTLVNGIMLLTKKSPKLRLNLILNHKIFGYNNSHRREISIYENIDKSLADNITPYLGYYTTGLPRTYNLLLDYCKFKEEKLTVTAVMRILDKILDFHTLYYGDINKAQKMGLNIYSPQDYRRAKKCIYELYNSRHNENIKLYGEKKDKEINEYINNIDKIADKYLSHRTFTHNDFSTRNIFYDKRRVLFYDFELSCYQNPEHDLIEFLMYDLGNFTDDEVKKIIGYYKRGLKRGGIYPGDKEFNKLLNYSAYEFTVNRLSMTKTINDNVKLDFAKLSIPNSVRLFKILDGMR